MTWSVTWDPAAVADLMQLSPADAARVDRFVQEYAVTGRGNVARVETENGPHFRLYVFPRFVVRFVLDRTTRTLHVWRVLVRVRGVAG
jgi:hypothetical protein